VVGVWFMWLECVAISVKGVRAGRNSRVHTLVFCSPQVFASMQLTTWQSADKLRPCRDGCKVGRGQPWLRQRRRPRLRRQASGCRSTPPSNPKNDSDQKRPIM
jgi:hypothetical protein